MFVPETSGAEPELESRAVALERHFSPEVEFSSALATTDSRQKRLAGLTARIPDARRLFRYGATSVIALGISEITLLLLFAHGVVGATGAAFLGNLAGTAPSYLLSRYWIWPEADRHRPVRQVIYYWTVSIVSMIVSSFATGAVAHHASGGKAFRLTVLGGSYLLISLILWIAKFVVYEAAIFRTSKAKRLSRTD